MKLKGKVALLTGAGSGIGREIALRFAREGCAVGVNDIRPEAAEAVAAEGATGAEGRLTGRRPGVINSEPR